MSSLVIRCRTAPASTAELSGWLEDRLAELRDETPQLLVRLTRLTQDLPDTSVDDGWLIEAEIPGEQPEEPFALLTESLEEIIRDMRILGLDPTLLVPVNLLFEEPMGASAAPA